MGQLITEWKNYGKFYARRCGDYLDVQIDGRKVSLFLDGLKGRTVVVPCYYGFDGIELSLDLLKSIYNGHLNDLTADDKEFHEEGLF